MDDTPLDGPDFVDYEWWEETSQFDSNPTKRWNYGCGCYEALGRCRVPGNLTDDEIDDWINHNWDRIKWLDPEVGTDV